MNTTPTIADSIYRPFFLAGIATVLTLGCVWGELFIAMRVGKKLARLDHERVLATDLRGRTPDQIDVHQRHICG